MNLKKLLIGTAVAAAVVGGGVILPATAAPTAPASAMNVCKTVRTTHTTPGCDTKKYICTYYTYKEVCTRY